MPASKEGKKATVAGFLGEVGKNPIVAEALEETQKRVVEEIDAEENYAVLLNVVWRIASSKGLIRYPFWGSCLMTVKDNPKYRSERWVVAVEPRGERSLPRLFVTQLLWSPSLGEYVDGVVVKLGRVRRNSLEVIRDADGLRWIEENPDGCLGIINFLTAAVPEE